MLREGVLMTFVIMGNCHSMTLLFVQNCTPRWEKEVWISRTESQVVIEKMGLEYRRWDKGCRFVHV